MRTVKLVFGTKGMVTAKPVFALHGPVPVYGNQYRMNMLRSLYLISMG